MSKTKQQKDAASIYMSLAITLASENSKHKPTMNAALGALATISGHFLARVENASLRAAMTVQFIETMAKAGDLGEMSIETSSAPDPSLAPDFK